MNNDEIIAQAVLFFLAAYDTTTTALSLTTLLLAQHLQVQDQLQAEIDAYLEDLWHKNMNKTEPDSGETQTQSTSVSYAVSEALSLVTFDSLAQLPYLNAVISECLRLYPPGTFTERTAARDMVLQTSASASTGSESEEGQKLEVKAGDVIRIPIYALHYDESQFPNSGAFEPNRFLGAENSSSFSKYAYLPFSQGPRNCPARMLALYETKIALIHVLSQYRVSLCPKTTIPVQFYNNGQILTPRDIFLQLKKR